MKIIPTRLPGVVICEPRIFHDDRGFFVESWNSARYADAGLEMTFTQDNISCSRHGVLRGLHYQHPRAQAKLVTVLRGEIYDVAVDIRRGSPWFGRWTGTRLSADPLRQLFIPRGFAHGFLALADNTLVAYKCSDYYDPASEHTLLWNDPAIGIEWPAGRIELSPKDADGLPLDGIAPDHLPEFEHFPTRAPSTSHAL